MRIFTLIAVGICFVNNSAVAAESRLAKSFSELRAEVAEQEAEKKKTEKDDSASTRPKIQRATFGNGCFWCTEAVFEELRGVGRVVSGYTGGKVKHPTYQQVCTGLTGHAEVIQLEYDPAVISYATLLEVFWRTHDPTTLNRQGPDVGTQYRSAVFYHNDEQKALAEHYKAKLNKDRAFRKPVVTEITKFGDFYSAEKYHQDYFKDNSRAGYCRQVIQPKVKKFRRIFADQLKQSKRSSSEKGE